MKKTIFVLTFLTVFPAIADEFKNPTFDGNSIHASSNSDSVCQVLTGDTESTSTLVMNEKFFFKYPATVVKVKSASKIVAKAYGGMFNQIGNLITRINCK